jgi:trehalose 6-phosphate synthase
LVPRLIVISNRVAVPGGPRQVGGLAVAVNAALKGREGLWFGWSGRTSETAADRPPAIVHRRRRSFVTIDLSPNDFQEYYNGFANRVLWPILHYRTDLAEFTSVELDGYLRVNARFADALSRFIAPDDWIWVHDYHLLPMAKALRARGHHNPIGFFLHIPCPPPDILLALPQHAETIGALAQYDLVGTQTEHDAANLRDYFELQGGQFGRNRTHFDLDGGRRVQLRSFPVGIATAVYARTARRSTRSEFADEVRNSLNDRKLILGVDRLDYSKGIPHRIQAYGQLLDTCPDWRGNVTYLQLTPKSRSGVPEYEDINRTVSSLVGQINGRYGNPAWTPIRYVNQAYSRAALAALYRLACIGLVTPLRDGMNLVAKEYVAAQDVNDPGVLVLSQFAGAAEELDGAILVNPHETEAVGQAIDAALRMPLGERQARHQEMLRHLLANDIDRWAEDFLAALAESRQPVGLLSNLRQLFAVRV